jgi:hypothetical protein
VPEYSSTPLVAKLGVRTHSTLRLVSAPHDFTLDGLDDVTVIRRGDRPVDVVLAFFASAVALERRFPALTRLIDPRGGLWIAWPKKSSGVATGVTDRVV